MLNQIKPNYGVAGTCLGEHKDEVSREEDGRAACLVRRDRLSHVRPRLHCVIVTKIGRV